MTYKLSLKGHILNLIPYNRNQIIRNSKKQSITYLYNCLQIFYKGRLCKSRRLFRKILIHIVISCYFQIIQSEILTKGTPNFPCTYNSCSHIYHPAFRMVILRVLFLKDISSIPVSYTRYGFANEYHP